MEEKLFYINEAQQECMMVNSRVQLNFVGRWGGKSTGMFPYKTHRCKEVMPKSTGGILCPSYSKALNDLITPMLRGWSMLGYEENVDFVISKEPPRAWKWETPYLKPKRYDYTIAWKNGSVMRIISQDKSVTSNGLEIQYLKGDEVKLLNRDKFVNETLPCLRGESFRWNHLPEYLSIEFFSDMYFDKRGGGWAKEMYEPFNDEAATKLIYQLAMLVEHLKNKQPNHPSLPNLEENLRKLRCDSVCIIKAPSTANRYVIGATPLRNLIQGMSIQEFKGSILTMEAVGGGDFYAPFDIDVHGYWAPDKNDNGLAEDLKKANDRCSNDDSDYDENIPLEITVDWGGTINTCGVYQERTGSIDKINELYCKPPQKYQDLARKYCYYYRFVKKKIVFFHYDPSGNATRADANETFAQEFAQILRDNGWKVIMMSLGGKNIGHARKHRLWSTVLVERNNKCTDPRFKVFRINRSNCPNSIISMSTAPIRIYKGAYEKDKRSEGKNSGVLPEHATHFSDGDDMIMVNKQLNILERKVSGYAALS